MLNSIEHANTLAKPPVFNPPGVWYSRVRCFQGTVPLTGQKAGDGIVLFLLPAGFRPAYGVVAANVFAPQFSIGTSENNQMFRREAALDSRDKPELFGIVESTRAPLDHSVTARLWFKDDAPDTGTIVVRLFGTGAD